MVTNAPEPDHKAEEAFVVEPSAEIHAAVQHHPPCVPECPVCYPKSPEGDD